MQKALQVAEEEESKAGAYTRPLLGLTLVLFSAQPQPF